MKIIATLTAAVALVAASASYAAASETAPKPSQTTETFGAWTVRCIANAEASCEAIQVINSQAGTIAEIAIALPKGQDQAVIASRAPLGVMISEPIRFGEKDSTESFEINYVTCVSQGCLAQARISADGLRQLAEKATGSLTFREHSGRSFQISVPLNGLKDALIRLSAGRTG